MNPGSSHTLSGKLSFVPFPSEVTHLNLGLGLPYSKTVYSRFSFKLPTRGSVNGSSNGSHFLI